MSDPIARAVEALGAFTITSRSTAAALLACWRHVDTLSETDRAAVIARVTEPDRQVDQLTEALLPAHADEPLRPATLCRCGGLIEYVVDDAFPEDPYWRHLTPPEASHAARLAATVPAQRGQQYDRDEPTGEPVPPEVTGQRLGSRWDAPPDGGDLP